MKLTEHTSRARTFVHLPVIEFDLEVMYQTAVTAAVAHFFMHLCAHNIESTPFPSKNEIWVSEKSKFDFHMQTKH